MPFLTAKEMQTALAMALKDVFVPTAREGAKLSDALAELQRVRPMFTGGARAKKKAKKATKKKKSDSTHASSKEPPVAVLGKGQGYAQNGSDFIRGLTGRGVYNQFGHLSQLVNSPLAADIHQTALFPGGPGQNFDPGFTFKTGKSRGKPAGQRFPYKWEAHHILPGSAFYYARNNKPVFTADQYELLLQTVYNINHGHNIIMLPKELWAVFVHSLVQHPGDHPNYTQYVMDGMVKISNTLDSLVKQKKPHKEVVANLFSELQGLETDCWDFLVKLGKSLFAALAKGKKFPSPFISEATKKGKKRASLA